ncbi:MAG: nicotinate-nucleotide--dimethylbenzimidazole phosphoribosyltransferase, partial [Rhodobacteraceae bacterium]|nr:nicotinate-nucleotide--dimethylbenzimidazole phosphoribosyltransferase [Paracoccaceae bacterium]
MPAPFSTLDAFRNVLALSGKADQGVVDAAAARNGQLTKPPGALGRLED